MTHADEVLEAIDRTLAELNAIDLSPDTDESSVPCCDPRTVAETLSRHLNDVQTDWNRKLTSNGEAVRLGTELIHHTSQMLEERDVVKLNQLLESITEPQAWLAILNRVVSNSDYLAAKFMRRIQGKSLT